MHHYGRHGPQAWLRWRKRHHARPLELPVPVVPTTMIIRIVVPITVERVMVILMPENQSPDETQQPTNLQAIYSQGAFQPPTASVSIHQESGSSQNGSEDNSSLVSHARLKARFDIRDMKRHASGGKVVILDRPRLEDRIGAYFDTHMEQNITRGEKMPGEQECRELEKQYREAYLKGLQEGINSEPIQLHILSTPIEVRLRELAIQDRKEFPSPWRRPFHQRDLAVVQVLLELGISLGSAREQLETIHNHADIYEKYFANAREEVTWPDPNSF